ncbi:MAG TPA: phosphatase PAP2 family protein [Terriglobia bacterium]|nr:phosphatase PAP2 family protein [Terriglobia bacterium]
MNWFDQWMIGFINSFAQRSWIADGILTLIASNVLIDAGVLMAMFWWAWIKYEKEHPEKREILAANLFVTAFAVVLARFLALSLPYRERPVRNLLLHFRIPFTANPNELIHWSSFPSDHAVLAFCIAAGLWLVSRRMGAFAITYAFVTNVPRIYTGAHYPTDFIAGALLGMGLGFLSGNSVLRNAARTCLDFLDRYPPYLYAILFCWTFEIGEMFDSLRHIAVLAAKTVMQLAPGVAEAVGIPLLVVLLGILGWLQWQKRKAAA